jgi:dihydrofolate synthase/folylpolyglutamate synthase
VNPDDPVAFIFGLERLGMKFGLENIDALCERLGRPERAFHSVIIAGTNGKGSVTAMVETALRASGHRTARYTSPHLVRIEERFVVQGAEVEPEAFRDAAGRVRRVIESMVASGALERLPTFFEATTAIAFELFRDRAVEIAVLEVGLGGRLDATNVVTPLVAAITSIDFDHEAQLGSTLAAIAREKAGVIKDGIPVVCGPLPAEAEAAIAEVCREHRARPIHAIDDVRITAAGPDVDVRSARRTLRGVRLALPGRHQVANAAVAVAVLDALDERGLTVTDDGVREGLSRTAWPARLERVRHGRSEVLLDAAHNPAGARALASYLHDIGWTGVTLVFGAMHDKDVPGMLEPLAPYVRTVICTTPPSPRALAAEDAAALASRAGARTDVVPDPAAALARACALDTRVVVAGSIFLVGALRDNLR